MGGKSTPMDGKTIPIVVGVTGHRNVVEEDKPALKKEVLGALKELQILCKSQKKGGEDTPLVLLGGFAEGADMLCAEAAFELGIDVYAILPREEEKYLESFESEADRAKLHEYLTKCKRVFLAPDMEENGAWLQSRGVDKESYEYRQLGIYIAEHSHVVLALWDGKQPKSAYGCGTAEVVEFALEHKYLNREHLFSPGAVSDSAVLWVKARRQGDDLSDIQTRWLTSDLFEGSGENAQASGAQGGAQKYTISREPPAHLLAMLEKTANYNQAPFSGEDPLWGAPQELDDYRKSLGYHYAKANFLSYRGNQAKYTLFLRLLALLSALVALTFLVYDDASLSFMIFPCTVLIAAVVVLQIVGEKKAYHRAYIDLRAFAEALRIQFYLSVATDEVPVRDSVCELYSWAQRVEFVWIDKALRALAVLSPAKHLQISPSEAVETWIGLSDEPKGQLKYHRQKIKKNAAMAKKYDRFSSLMLGATLVLYAAILILEICSCIFGAAGLPFFWDGALFGDFSWRSLGAVLLGTVAAASLLFSSYWGKLSYGRRASDNEKMGKFYAAAYARWQDMKDRPKEEQALFLKEIAREEIVENGIWYSYVNENRLEIDL